MEFREFEDSIVVTHTHRPDALTYAILGVAGEAGEVAEAYKKALREVSPHELCNMITPGQYVSSALPHRHKMLDEIGDVLWCLAKAVKELGSSLEDVARFNMEKMEFRNKFGKEEGDRQHAASRRSRQ